MIGHHTYYISLVECNGIHLRFVKVLDQGIPLFITKQEEEDIHP